MMRIGIVADTLAWGLVFPALAFTAISCDEPEPGQTFTEAMEVGLEANEYAPQLTATYNGDGDISISVLGGTGHSTWKASCGHGTTTEDSDSTSANAPAEITISEDTEWIKLEFDPLYPAFDKTIEIDDIEWEDPPE